MRLASFPLVGLLLIAASWSLAGALAPAPGAEGAPAPPGEVCTPAAAAGPLSLAAVCQPVPAAPAPPEAPDAVAAARAAIASTHDHDHRYYTQGQSDARFLAIGAQAVDSALLDGLDSAQFLRSDRSGSVAGSLAASGDLDAGGRVREGGAVLVPPGAVMAFNRAACPAGWAPFAAADGRVVVGGGSVGATRGAALADGGGRLVHDVPQHLHVVRIAGGNPHQVPVSGPIAQEPQALGQALFAEVGSTGYRDPPGPFGMLTGYTGRVGGVDVTMPYVQLRYCEKL